MEGDLEKKILKIHSLNGSIHTSDASNIQWPKSVDPSPTKEEAINVARVEAIKKGKPFREAQGADLRKIEDEAVERYVDDLMEKLL